MRILLVALVLSVQAYAVAYRRETSLPLQRCVQTDIEKDLPIASRYAQRIFRHIAAAHPDTFRGDLAPDLFCVGASNNFGGLRAWAEAETRSFLLEPGLVQLVENEAQLAFVMSHELAHITMRNALCDGYPALPDRDILVTRKCELDRLVEERSAGKATLPAEKMEALSQRIDELQALVQSAVTAAMGPERAANWVEVEADEVGRAIYLGAGFSESEATWRHEQIVLWPPFGIPTGTSLSASQRRAAALSSCGLPPGAPAPSRGIHRYADTCWSLWNFLVNPANLITSSGTRTLAGSPTLVEAKEEIRRKAAEVVPVKPGN